MKSLSIILIIFLANSLYAQQTGKVEYKSLGIVFDVPSGWQGQETEMGFLIASNTIPGFILLTTNNVKTLEEMEKEARLGIADENGNTLKLVGETEKLDAKTLKGQYEGTLEWQPAKANIIGIANSLGSGVTIITATASDKYSEIHDKIGEQVAESVLFFKPIIPPIAKEWKQKLNNSRLTYMDSYYSNDGVDDAGYSTGGGYSSKEIIDLCAQGFFNHSSSSSMSFDTGGGFGSSSGNDQGAGTWKVVGNEKNQPVLHLNFYNGKVSEYVITISEDKTLLNGYRYYRTYGTYADDGPNCN